MTNLYKIDRILLAFERVCVYPSSKDGERMTVSEARQAIADLLVEARTDEREEVLNEIMRGQHGHTEVQIVRSLQEDINTAKKLKKGIK